MEQPEQVFDRYVIESLIGEGGMGRVYRARDDRLLRRVALKVLRVDDGVANDARARLLHEARAAASLDHVNTVAIYDVGEALGVPFIAMELVVGRSLRSIVADRSVDQATRVRYLIDVARALQAAHDRGILHRDVKPENVLVRRDGVVKVVDFGIARSLDPLIAEPASLMPRALAEAFDSRTRSGLVGTPRYMAPEQFHGERLDARTDQFSWGVLAYELLTGHSPWDDADGTTSFTLVAAIVGEGAAPLDRLTRVAAEPVIAAIGRALSKRRDDRFPSMQALIDILADSQISRSGGRRFTAQVPGVEVNGKFADAIIDAFGAFGGVARSYMHDHGLDPDAIGPDDWMSQEVWLRIWTKMIAEVGPGVIFNIGQNIPEHSAGWPTEIVAALASIDRFYHLSHRKNGHVMYEPGTGVMLDGIGHYAVSYDPAAAKRATITCDDPYPCELDHGILTAVVRACEPLARVEHAPLRCRTLGAASCVYVVEWD